MAQNFHVVVPQVDEELAADRLWQLGVEAVAVGAPHDGCVELWTSVGSSAHALQRAVAALDPGWRWHVTTVADPVQTWRDHVAPTWYSPRGVVVPAWQTVDVPADVLVTSIEPASSFGLGDHPTTVATLALLSAHVRRTGASTVLDVGCGSGVLGIVAAQLGAVVRATDISVAAIEATEANALRNGVGGRLTADTAELASIAGPFDVVVANILAPVLVSLADELRRLIGPAGTLLISGILADAHDHVLAALAPLEVVATRTVGGWVSIALAAPER